MKPIAAAPLVTTLCGWTAWDIGQPSVNLPFSQGQRTRGELWLYDRLEG
jgi:hypothetical protein